MHHAILGLSGRDQTALEAGRLRPSSASLPPHAMTELEALLRARHRKLWHDRASAEAKSKRRVTPKGQGPVAGDIQRVCSRSDPMPGKGHDGSCR